MDNPIENILKDAMGQVKELRSKMPKMGANFSIRRNSDGSLDYSVACIEPRSAVDFFIAFEKHLKKKGVV